MIQDGRQKKRSKYEISLTSMLSHILFQAHELLLVSHLGKKYNKDRKIISKL